MRVDKKYLFLFYNFQAHEQPPINKNSTISIKSPESNTIVPESFTKKVRFVKFYFIRDDFYDRN